MTRTTSRIYDNGITSDADEHDTQITEGERRLLNELTFLLSDYVGETGESEGAVDVLSRLLEELEGYRAKEQTKERR